MRNTLRRSCDACARSKLRCDLSVPRCSRCVKKNTSCAYVNEPLSAPTDSFTVTQKSSSSSEKLSLQLPKGCEISLSNPGNQSFDPFDSYPQTRLPRAQVQTLMQHFLSTIAFQYYPLDLDATSNPFVISWFPSALADPALFHVSLQTASLDVELRAQKGFATSDILMADSVSLVRSKVENPVLAIQDETLDSVVTLAAIEFGKGNTAVSQLHIDGVKSMIRMRGGIQRVKAASPLTARMVSWVAMIVLQSPQFPTQGDNGVGDGVGPIPQWFEVGNHHDYDIPPPLGSLDLGPAISDILGRLRMLFHHPEKFSLSTTSFHDLTCFVLHRLLDQENRSQYWNESHLFPISEIVRLALALYMFTIHGPTYFSHVRLQYTITLQLKNQLGYTMDEILSRNIALAVWILSVGMVASDNTTDHQWFTDQARNAAVSLTLLAWDSVLPHLKHILWLERRQDEYLFRKQWEGVFMVDHS
ncbi:hypothetical protein GQ44DRAFT_773647 [Phaeosphaeriaceae sp. PMI808]|nr:hypothetical protein GQ44DRAFT_773647 [Phaeosphaeriaceae sp. PMI808]